MPLRLPEYPIIITNLRNFILQLYHITVKWGPVRRNLKF
jgi:hypothetical protein